jgi:hypothetical protein
VAGESVAGPWARHGLIVLLADAVLCVPQGVHSYRQFTHGDSVIFLYAGQQLLGGARLYLDVWDHKPPLIFYLNAAGLWLAHGSPAGVLALCAASAGLAFLLWYKLAAEYFGRMPALVAVLFAVNLYAGLAVANPNLTEVFALPFQALSVLLACREWSRKTGGWSPWVQGSIGSILFFLRPNNAGAALFYVLGAAVVLRRKGQLALVWGRLARFALGAVLVAAVIVIPFVRTHALAELWQATIGFNLSYSEATSWQARLTAFIAAAGYISKAGAGLLAAAVLAGLWWGRIFRRVPMPDIMAGASLLLAIEVALSEISGNAYRHYTLPWLLPMVLLLAYFWSLALDRQALTRAARVPLLPGLALLLVAGCGMHAVAAVRDFSNGGRLDDDRIIQNVRSNTHRDDLVYVWQDNDHGTLFRIGRRSPSRFCNLAPFLHTESGYRRAVPGILRDLEARSPKVIVEYSGVEIPALFLNISPVGECHALGPALGPEDWDDEDIRRTKAQLQSRYEPLYCDPRSNAAVYGLR